MPITDKEAEGAAPGADLASRFEALAKRKVVLAGLIIFAVALVVRVGFFTVQVMHGPQLWSHSSPMVESEMGFISTNLAQGRGFSSPFSRGSTPTAWVPPLIPLLWAFVIRCVGSATGFTSRLIGYSDTVPSALCVVVYWLIARHILRGRPALRRAAFLVAAIFCVWPEALYELDFLWYFQWQELATALVVLLGMLWIDRPSLKTVVPLGIMGGILALINVTPMPIFVVILLLPAIGNRERRRQMLGYGAAGASLALLIVLPWLIRNAVVLHAIVPVRSNAGFQFWEGNNPEGCVRETHTSRHPFYQPAEMRRYDKLGEIRYSRQGFGDAFAYIRTHPLETVVRTAERAYVFWLTDVTDHWSWGKTKYWQMGRPEIMKSLSSTLTAWGTVSLLLWALWSGRLAALPYKWLFISILFFLPLPYYFTLAENQYSQILRSWLLLLTILAFAAGFRRARSQRAAAQA